MRGIGVDAKAPSGENNVVWRREREEAAAGRVAQDFGCQLVTMRESPDAELTSPRGESIGLEVVSVVDQAFLDSRRRLVETTEAIEQALIEGGLQSYVSIGFDLQAFGIADYGSHKKWLNGLNLSRVLNNEPSGRVEQDALQNAGIERIAWVSWRPSESPGVSWGYLRRTEPGMTLVDLCLAKKDEKLTKYKESEDRFDAYWLAIDSIGAGTVEDGGFAMLEQRSFVTAYDRVFLLERGKPGKFARARDVTPKPATCGDEL